MTPLRLLRIGTVGDDVGRWQTFLRGQGYPVRVDEDFGPQTERYTKRYQAKKRLKSDGIVGARTVAKALLDGAAGVIEPAEAPPPAREGLRPLGPNSREALFGGFEYRPQPTERNPEHIVLLGRWRQENIVTVKLPQLRDVQAPSRTVRIHRKVAESFLQLWSRWESAGVLKAVRTWNGSFVPRFVRGSHTRLSNHSWGTAFDLNARWNRLGQVPAATGAEGSVLELVPIANELGWFWGGHFQGRTDGMHFEATRDAIR